MPGTEREPESYGSGSDWTSGKTGQKIDRGEAPLDSQSDFYESRRESETSAPRQGGLIQPEWTDHVDVLNPVAMESSVDDPVRKVTAEKGGAKRGGFFKRRDYE